jgi:hypothetical protein
MTTSLIVPVPGAISSPQAWAAGGDPITTIRSPGRITSPPRGMTTLSPRMIAATRDSGGIRASRSGTPTTLAEAAAPTSNSTSCTWPSANTSVWRAAGTPIVREMAEAVSTSEETMKSTSSWPSRQTSRYSGFVVRTTVVVRGEIAFVIMAATMFDSSREVQAISRSALFTPAAERTPRLAPFPSKVCTS